MNRLKLKPQSRRDASDQAKLGRLADTARLKAAGVPSHINAREERMLKEVMPQAAGPVITRGLLAEAGVKGDDRVTNLIPAERRLLKAHGGSGDRNPVSGLLQFEDDTGTGNPGGGHDASAAGGPGSSGGYGGYSGSSSVGGGGGYYGGDVNTKPDIANMSLSDLQDQFSQHQGSFINSLLSMPSGFKAPGYEGLSTRQYSPLDTWSRLAETALFGPPGKINAPGKFGMPTGLGPGITRTALSSLVAGPAAPALSGLMTLGGWMQASMSPGAQAKSQAEMSARGAMNSGGNSHTAAGTSAGRAPGFSSGAETARLSEPVLGNPVNALAANPWVTEAAPDDGLTLESSIGRKQASSDRVSPLRNMLIDYILTGRQGDSWWS
jgi:hypothetical protein